MEIVIEQRRWMDIVIEQWCALEDAKQKKARAGCRNHSSTTTASQPKKADIIQCAHVIFCWGSVRDTLARRMPYEMLVPKELTENENEQPQTYIAMGSMKK